MKSIWRVASSVTGLVATAVLLQYCGGSSHNIQPLIITTAALPNGTAGTQYSQTIQATGGVGPYSWSPSTGTLPHNLQLGSSNTNTNTISGTPDTPIQGDAFTVKVTDATGQSATQPYTVSILALPDTLILAPATLTFNAQADGTASGTQSATLTNTGTATVAINGVTSTGSNAGDFSESNTCTSGLAPGANCVLTVTFTPSQAGPRVASVTITDDTMGSPHQVGLNGTGLAPGANATLSASSLTFIGQAVGTASAAQTLTLANYGTGTLNIAGIAATGDFAETSTCGPTLSSAASCPISVSFTPSTMGNLAGQLSVTDNIAGSPQTIALSGTGTTTKGTLNGICFGLNASGQCTSAQDLASCPVGTAAITPEVETLDCFPSGTAQANVDQSTLCQGNGRQGHVTGNCEVQ